MKEQRVFVKNLQDFAGVQGTVVGYDELNDVWKVRLDTTGRIAGIGEMNLECLTKLGFS